MPPSRLIVAALLVVVSCLSKSLPMHAQQVAAIAQVASVTTTTLQVTPGSGALGSKFILSASVAARGGPETAGTVSFYNGATLLGTADILVHANAHGAVGSASFVTRGLPLGGNAITARFNGAGSDSPSVSAVRSVTVSGTYPTAAALTARGENGIYQLAADVFASGVGTPTGTVTFTDVTKNTTLGTAAAGASTTTFVANPTPLPYSMIDVAIGDVNGDGIEDIAVAGYDASYISVALGNGDGTFASPTDVGPPHPGVFVGVVLLADLNGDGNLDIVVTLNSPAAVAVFLGNGNGTFGAESDYPVDVYSPSVAVADFNGDGKLDIATATMNILLGKGDGTFQTRLNGTTDSNPFSVTVGDYNGDGKMDAAVLNQTGTVSLFLGNGDGTFAPQILLADSPGAGDIGPHSIATSDINGDGKLDIVVTDYAVGIFLGNGDGTFQAVQHFSPGDFTPIGIVVADINGDGKPDIAVSSEGNGAKIPAVVLLNNGNQTFHAEAYARSNDSYDSTTVVVGDLNGDGIQDLVVSGFDTEVSILLGETAFTASLDHVSLPGSGRDTVSATYGGDTHFAASTSNTVTIPTKSTATVPYPTATTLTATGSEGSYQLNAAVIASGEGTPTGTVTFTDLTTNTTLGAAAAGARTTTFTAHPSIGIPVQVTDVALGDVNGDGTEDMVILSYYGGILVALGNGDGTFASPTFVAPAQYGVAVTLADLNGDGKTDIIVVSSGVAVFLGKGDGTFAEETDYPVANAPQSVAVADFNGDGKLDIVTAGYEPAEMSILLGKGDGTFQTEHDYPTDSGSQSVTVGDYNGDGKMDVAVLNVTGTVSIFLGKGDGTFAPQTLVTGSVSNGLIGPHGIANGDLNGDGKLDIVLANRISNVVGVLFGNGNGTFQAVQQFSLPTDSAPFGVIVADINGDGKPDIAAVAAGYFEAFVLLNNGNQTFQTTDYLPGYGAASFAVADLNGDGLPDIAVLTGETSDILLGQTAFTSSLGHVSLPGSGSDTVIARYSGDTHFAGSTSNTLTLTSMSPVAATPTFSPAPGPYTSTQTVKLADATAGASIYYTTNGSTPTTASTKYAAAITVSATETIKAIAVATGYTNSAVGSAMYSINVHAATPTITLASGTYTMPTSTTITDYAGTNLFYCTSTSGNCTPATTYTAAVTINASPTEYLCAYGTATGYAQSATVCHVYTNNKTTIPAATPTITLASGTYALPTSTTITDYAGTNLFYCTSTSGNCTPGTAYTAAVTINAAPTKYVCAYGTAAGYAQSATVCHVYTNAASAIAATPTFSQPAGTYTGTQTIKLADATAGATIYYTTNGTAPTAASTPYTAAIAVSATEKIYAIAVATGYTTSAIAHATFTIQ